MKCQYLRETSCYVTGRKCESGPEKCHMSEREFMVLDEAEEECMRPPTDYKCHICKRIFLRPRVRLRFKRDKEGREVGHFYCHECDSENRK